jgi:hypothetical protein
MTTLLINIKSKDDAEIIKNLADSFGSETLQIDSELFEDIKLAEEIKQGEKGKYIDKKKFINSLGN